jgi:hypothetical protein
MSRERFLAFITYILHDSGVQAAPLSELRQGLGVRFKDKIKGVKRNFGGVEHFIRGVREILGGF